MIEKYLVYYIFLRDFFSESMKKESGGRITSLTLERRGMGGGREREGWLEMRRETLRLGQRRDPAG